MSRPEFKIGDIIIAYHKGYHKVTSVGACLTYVRVDGKRRTENMCDRLWCEKVDVEELHKQLITEADRLRDALLAAQQETP